MSKLIAVYEPKGKAREYAELALNIFETCKHGCTYCYAPKVMHKLPEEFYGPTKPRKDIIRKVEADAIKLQAEYEQREILLSFTSDPYQSGPGPEDTLNRQTTRRIIQILLEAKLNITILTKGGLNSVVDLDLLEQYKDQVRYGATLVFKEDKYCKTFEPYAPPTSERIKALKLIHSRGIRTWASIEPAWSIEDTIKIIEDTHEVVDAYMIGKLNYHPHTKEVDWKEYTKQTIMKLQELTKPFYVKQDLRKYFPIDIDLYHEMVRNRPGQV